METKINSKILFFDLETVGPNALRSDLGMVVCFGYKFLGDKKANVLTIDKFKNWFSTGKGLNDKELIKAALKIMEQADILVAHYGEKFDRRFLQGRCAIHNLDAPPPTKLRDTWRIAGRAFNFSSNRLGNLAETLGLKNKKTTKNRDAWPGWWARSAAGDTKAIHLMADYCAKDVNVLEELYLRLRPYDLNHPRLLMDRETCNVCGGKIEYRGFAFVGEHKYRRYVCKSCRKWSREMKAVKDEKDK